MAFSFLSRPNRSAKLLGAVSAFMVLPIGFAMDQALVLGLGRVYWHLPRLEFFWCGFPLIALLICKLLRMRARTSYAHGVAIGFGAMGAVIIIVPVAWILLWTIAGMRV